MDLIKKASSFCFYMKVESVHLKKIISNHVVVTNSIAIKREKMNNEKFKSDLLSTFQ